MRIAFWRAKTTKASEITSGRFPVDRLPAMTDEYIWVGTGTNVEERAVPAGPTAAGLAIFGDGSDGDVTVNSDDFSSGPITSNVLTRDAFFNNLTIESTRTLDTAGYKIFVKGTLTNNGTISRNGNDGITPTAGAALATHSLGGSGAGGAGGASYGGGGGSGGGVILIVAKIIDNSSGTISANGGEGGDGITGAISTEAGEVGGNASLGLGGDGGKGGKFNSDYTDGGTVSPPTSTPRVMPESSLLREGATRYLGGAGGGGGIARATNNAGGGGGGGGGAIILIYNSATWGTEEVNGGAFGVHYLDALDGTAGSVGTVIKIANA